MAKRPFLIASMTIGAIFLFFLLVILVAGMLGGQSVVPGGDKIGILEVRGEIEDARALIEQIADFTDTSAVKAVVLRIDSPGGGVGPSQELHAELKRLAEVKPLIVSMGSVAASGGYYIAVAGEQIFANPGTITGSIGVIMTFPDLQQLMGKVGIKTEVVKSGQFKDIGSATRDFSASDRQLLQEMINDVHQQFVQAISEGRDIPIERLQPFVDGRIFTGTQALNAGLIDQLGTYNDAIRYAAKITGLGDDPDLIYPEPEHRDFIDRIINGAISRYLGMSIRPHMTVGPQFLWDGY